LYEAPTNSYNVPSSSYGAPSISDAYGAPSNRYETVVKFDDTQSAASNKHSATKQPETLFEQTVHQKKSTNVENVGTQHPVSQVNANFQSKSPASSSSLDNRTPNYSDYAVENFGNKVKQSEQFDVSDSTYSDRQDNPATLPLHNTGLVKFPNTQSEFLPSVKEWKVSSEQRLRSSNAAEVKQR
jgi:hypothetical protein